MFMLTKSNVIFFFLSAFAWLDWAHRGLSWSNKILCVRVCVCAHYAHCTNLYSNVHERCMMKAFWNFQTRKYGKSHVLSNPTFSIHCSLLTISKSLFILAYSFLFRCSLAIFFSVFFTAIEKDWNRNENALQTINILAIDDRQCNDYPK